MRLWLFFIFIGILTTGLILFLLFRSEQSELVVQPAKEKVVDQGFIEKPEIGISKEPFKATEEIKRKPISIENKSSSIISLPKGLTETNTRIDRVIDTQVDQIDTDLFLRKRIVKTKMKYPFIQIDEVISYDPIEKKYTRLNEKAYVADHVMTYRLANVPAGSNEGQVALQKLKVRKEIDQREDNFLIEIDEVKIDGVQDMIAKLKKEIPDIGSEPDYIVYATATPNDPSFGSLWGLHQNNGVDIDAPEAWDYTTGSSNVIVAVIDTGVDYNHPDLTDNMWKNLGEIGLDGNGDDKQTNGIDDDGNGYKDDVYGYDFYSNDGNPTDETGHGTHCSGTIGAKGNNSSGIVGVNWTVKIMAIRFIGADGGFTSDSILSLNYSVARGASLSSNSWGGGGYSVSLKTAIENAGNQNKLFVAAAGNDNLNTDIYGHYPSSYNSANIISVASMTSSGTRSSFSNYGATTVDFAAPGSTILSSLPNSSYAYYSGTSMACPHVSGAAALLLSARSDLTFAEIKTSLLEYAKPNSIFNGLAVKPAQLNVFNSLKEVMVPSLVIESVNIVDNQNQVFNPGETVALKIKLKNIGLIKSSLLNLSLTTDSLPSGVSLVQNSASISDLQPDASMEFTAFSIAASDLTQDATWSTNLSVQMAGMSFKRLLPLNLRVERSKSIFGEVTDLETGIGISGATITASGTLSTYTTTSNSGGSYQLDVPSGTYNISVTAPTFSSKTTVQTLGENSIRLDFALGYGLLSSSQNTVSFTTAGTSVLSSSLLLSNAGNLAVTCSVSSFEFINSQATSSQWLSLNVSHFVISQGGTKSVSISVNPGYLKAGTYQGKIKIDNDSRNNAVLEIGVVFTISPRQDFRLEPIAPFGEIYIGSSSTKILKLINAGNEDVSISSATSDKASFSVTPTNFLVQAYNSFDADVTFAPTTVVATTASLSFVSSIGTKTAQVSGSGVVGPLIQISPMAIQDQLHNEGTSSHLVTITNVGDKPLSFTISSQDEIINYISNSPNLLSTGDVVLGKAMPENATHGLLDDSKVQISLVGTITEDSLHYTWSDSSRVNGPVYHWYDAKNLGTKLALSGNQNASQLLHLSFPFPYYAAAYSDVYVSSNGYVSFQNSSNVPTHVYYPSGSLVDRVIAPMHQNTCHNQFEIYAYDDGNKLILQFEGMGPNINDTSDYQIILYNNGLVIVNYKKVQNSLYYSVGFQANDVNGGLSIAYNAAYLQNNFSVRIGKKSNWLSLDTVGGSVAANGTGSFNISLHPSGLNTGDYTMPLKIRSNAANQSNQDVVSVKLKVNAFQKGRLNISHLDLGDLYQSASKVGVFRFENIGNENITLHSVTSDHAGITITNASTSNINVAPYSFVEFGVKLTGLSLGQSNGQISVLTSEATGQNSHLLQVSGNVLASPLIYSLVPSSISIRAGQKISGQIDITNNGTVALQVTPASITKLGTSSYLGTFKIDTSVNLNGPVYQWNDISGSGRRLSVSDHDDVFSKEFLAHDVLYFGKKYTFVYVSSNGYLVFNNGTMPSYVSSQASLGSLPKGTLGGYVKDLNPLSQGDVYFEEFADRFIVQYENVRVSGGGLISFQMVVYYDGNILIEYKDIASVSTDDLILSGADGSVAKMPGATSNIVSGMAIRLVPIDNLFLFDTDFVNISGGQSVSLTFDFDATYAVANEFVGVITLNATSSSNQFISNLVLPVELKPKRSLAFDISKIDFGEVVIGTSHTKNVLLQNNGEESMVLQSIQFSQAKYQKDSSLLLPKTLNPQESVWLPIVLTEAELGYHEATMTVLTNDQSFAIAMSATGAVNSIASFVVEELPRDVERLTDLPLQIKAYNHSNVIDSTFNGSVPLGVYKGDYGKKLLISEVSVGVPDYIEIKNVFSEPVDTTGFKLYVSDSLTDAKSFKTFTLSGTLSSGSLMYVTDDPGDHYIGYNLVFEENKNFWVGLINSDNQVVDLVYCGFDFTSMKNSSSLLFDNVKEVLRVELGQTALERIGQVDTDSSSDFTWVAGSKGIENVGISNVFNFNVPVSPSSIAFVNGLWSGNLQFMTSLDAVKLNIHQASASSESGLFNVKPKKPQSSNVELCLQSAGSDDFTISATSFEGGTPVVVLDSNPVYGTLTHLGGDSYRYVANAISNVKAELDTISYHIDDGFNVSGAYTVEVLIGSKPILANSLYETRSNQVNLVQLQLKPNNLSYDFTIVGLASNGSVSVNGNAIQYTPNPNYIGFDSFAVTSKYKCFQSAPLTVNVSVGQPPVLEDKEFKIYTTGSINEALVATDPNGLGLTYQLISSPTSGSFALNNNVVQFSPSLNANHDVGFSVIVKNPYVSSAVKQYSIKVVKAIEPVNLSLKTYSDKAVSFYVSDGLSTISSIVLPSGLKKGEVKSLGANQYSYIPKDGSTGNESMIFKMTDAFGAQYNSSVNIELVARPVADSKSIVMEMNAVSKISLSGKSSQNGVGFKIVSPPANGLLELVEGQAYNYTPKKDFFGSDQFEYVLVDGMGISATAKVTIKVLETIASKDLEFEITDNKDFSFDLKKEIGFHGEQTIDLKIEGVFKGTYQFDKDILRLKPARSTNYSVSFNGLVFEEALMRAKVKVTIIVKSSNKAPVGVDDHYLCEVNGSIVMPVLRNDTDIDGDKLSVGGVLIAPQKGVLTKQGDELLYKPALDFVGKDFFVYSLKDDFGGEHQAKVNIDVAKASSSEGFYKLRIAFGQGGRVLPGGVMIVTKDDSVLVDFLPEAGYELHSVLVNGELLEVKGLQQTLSKFDKNILLEARFARIALVDLIKDEKFAVNPEDLTTFRSLPDDKYVEKLKLIKEISKTDLKPEDRVEFLNWIQQALIANASLDETISAEDLLEPMISMKNLLNKNDKKPLTSDEVLVSLSLLQFSSKMTNFDEDIVGLQLGILAELKSSMHFVDGETSKIYDDIHHKLIKSLVKNGSIANVFKNENEGQKYAFTLQKIVLDQDKNEIVVPSGAAGQINMPTNGSWGDMVDQSYISVYIKSELTFNSGVQPSTGVMSVSVISNGGEDILIKGLTADERLKISFQVEVEQIGLDLFEKMKRGEIEFQPRYFDVAKGEWSTEGITDISFDSIHYTVSFYVSHLTDFALFEKTKEDVVESPIEIVVDDGEVGQTPVQEDQPSSALQGGGSGGGGGCSYSASNENFNAEYLFTLLLLFVRMVVLRRKKTVV